MLRRALSTIFPTGVIDIVLEYGFRGKKQTSYILNHVQFMTIIQYANGEDTKHLLVADNNSTFLLYDVEHLFESTFFAKYPKHIEVRCMVAWLGTNGHLFIVRSSGDIRNLHIGEYVMEGAKKGTLIRDFTLSVRCDHAITLLARMPQDQHLNQNLNQNFNRNLLAVGWDNGLKVFDLDSRACLFRCADNGPVINLQWIRDEFSVPTLRFCSDNTIVQWNPVTREKRTLIDIKEYLIVCFSFRSDGQQCGIGTRNRFFKRENTLRDYCQLWEWQECKWQYNPNVFQDSTVTSYSRVCNWVRDTLVVFENIGAMLITYFPENHLPLVQRTFHVTLVPCDHLYSKFCLVWNHEKLLLCRRNHLMVIE